VPTHCLRSSAGKPAKLKTVKMAGVSVFRYRFAPCDATYSPASQITAEQDLPRRQWSVRSGRFDERFRPETATVAPPGSQGSASDAHKRALTPPSPIRWERVPEGRVRENCDNRLMPLVNAGFTCSSLPSRICT
jgi:hypothetical protein